MAGGRGRIYRERGNDWLIYTGLLWEDEAL
jgi:hypothetical protein